MTLLAFLPPVQYRVSICHRRYCASLPCEMVADVSNTEEIMDFFDRLLQEPQRAEQRLAGARRQAENDITDISLPVRRDATLSTIHPQ